MATILVPYLLAAEDGALLLAQDGANLVAEVYEEQVGRTAILYGAIRTRLLGYDPTGRAALGQLLTGGLYSIEAPDKASYPFGVLRLMNRRTGPGDDGRLREKGELQVTLYGVPRTSFDTIETAMDVIENALYGWNTDADGTFTIRGMLIRATLPGYQSPENREILSVRATWVYTWWPSYRTHLAVASGAPAPV